MSYCWFVCICSGFISGPRGPKVLVEKRARGDAVDKADDEKANEANDNASSWSPAIAEILAAVRANTDLFESEDPFQVRPIRFRFVVVGRPIDLSIICNTKL